MNNINFKDKVFFFTHIPKTAGTTIQKNLFLTNISFDSIRNMAGLKDLIFNPRPFNYLAGHYPYGRERGESVSGIQKRAGRSHDRNGPEIHEHGRSSHTHR